MSADSGQAVCVFWDMMDAVSDWHNDGSDVLQVSDGRLLVLLDSVACDIVDMRAG